MHSQCERVGRENGRRRDLRQWARQESLMRVRSFTTAGSFPLARSASVTCSSTDAGWRGARPTRREGARPRPCSAATRGGFPAPPPAALRPRGHVGDRDLGRGGGRAGSRRRHRAGSRTIPARRSSVRMFSRKFCGIDWLGELLALHQGAFVARRGQLGRRPYRVVSLRRDPHAAVLAHVCRMACRVTLTDETLCPSLSTNPVGKQRRSSPRGGRPGERCKRTSPAPR